MGADGALYSLGNSVIIGTGYGLPRARRQAIPHANNAALSTVHWRLGHVGTLGKLELKYKTLLSMKRIKKTCENVLIIYIQTSNDFNGYDMHLIYGRNDWTRLAPNSRIYRHNNWVRTHSHRVGHTCYNPRPRLFMQQIPGIDCRKVCYYMDLFYMRLAWKIRIIFKHKGCDLNLLLTQPGILN